MAIVLVTGTSSGIGLAPAAHFARQGHEVWAGVGNPATATELRENVAGGRAMPEAQYLDEMRKHYGFDW
jgi:NAD(P)-dependent dehydrogenase (short-subunit alcohol dehydrogenase family)